MVISSPIPHPIYPETKPLAEGISRVMLVLLALGKDNAAGVLEALEPKELEAISRSAAELQDIDVSGLEDAAREFEKSFNDTLEFLGTPDEVRDLLAMAGPKPLGDLPEITNRVSIWESIAGIETERLTTYLNAQHPQAISLILSKLESDRAAEILGGFSSAQRNDLMARMLSLRAVAPEILQMVEAALDADLLQAPPADAVHHKSIADLLNRLDQQQSNEVLQYIQDVRPKDGRYSKTVPLSILRLGHINRKVVVDYHRSTFDRKCHRCIAWHRCRVSGESVGGDGSACAKDGGSGIANWCSGYPTRCLRSPTVDLRNSSSPSG